ncbi:MAG: hypothetical protein V4525_11100 [Pseudomonadota bacterium]
MSSKTWNYQELTAAAEKEIKKHMKSADQKSGYSKELFEHWAQGVFIFWDNLTFFEFQLESDHERLNNLVHPSLLHVEKNHEISDKLSENNIGEHSLTQVIRHACEEAATNEG